MFGTAPDILDFRSWIIRVEQERCRTSEAGVRRVSIWSWISMAEDVASVRAEIKAWERGFLDKHERNPTVEDIRENQLIGTSSSRLVLN